jgi:hypothetical protein
MTREGSVTKAKYSGTDAKLHHINGDLNEKKIVAGLNSNVHISEVNMSSLHAMVRKGSVDVPTLARNLGISLEVAKPMRAVTTQRGVKSMIYPSLNRRRSMNDRHMRYMRLPMTLFPGSRTLWLRSCALKAVGRGLTHRGRKPMPMRRCPCLRSGMLCWRYYSWMDPMLRLKTNLQEVP